LLTKAEVLVEKAILQNVIGEFPFESPSYIASVFENLKSTIPIKLNPEISIDHLERFKVMIRNVTDDRFLGEDIRNGKSFFFGGTEHFRTIYNKLDSNSLAHSIAFFEADSRIIPSLTSQTKTEGYYLANQYESTKGKVYSIGLFSLGVSIEDSIQIVDPRLNYRTEIQLIELQKKGLIGINEPVITGKISLVAAYMYKLSYQFPECAFRIKDMKAIHIVSKYISLNRMSFINDYMRYDDYNTCIFIPHSPVGYF
jgi:hypothetical protein